MDKIEKIFEKVIGKNHAISTNIETTKIRIKDKCFGRKSIYKIVEHIKWMKEMELNNTKLKIIIDSDYFFDQPTVMLLEMLIYYLIKYLNVKVTYRAKMKENILGFILFKKSILYKFNNVDILKKEYIEKYEKNIYICKDRFRKRFINNEENKKSNLMSITFTEIETFLKGCGFDDEYIEGLPEAIIEIIDNVYNHSEGDCILNIDVLKNTQMKYKYIEVTTLAIDDIALGDGVIKYIQSSDKSQYNKMNEIVLEAYNNHKSQFNKNYDESTFAMISTFQKYVTTRKRARNSGGTRINYCNK